MTAVPKREGFFWAKWVKPTPGTADFDQWEASNNWEPIEVWFNGGEPGDPEEYLAFVGGVQKGQTLDCFICGPEISPPLEIE